MRVLSLRRRRDRAEPEASTAPAGLVDETPEQLLLRLDFRVLRRLDGLLQGDHRTLFYGSGMDFADLREYANDDVRHIDWNVTARLDTPYVRTFHEERDLTAWFLVDRSASMRFATERRGKQAVGAEMVTAMARLITRRGDRVAAMSYDDQVLDVIEPGTGRLQVLRLARELRRPLRTATTRSQAPTDLAQIFEAASARIRRRSLVIVVSDFQTDSDWEPRLRLLARRHDVIAIRPVDPLEHELPASGVVVVRDAETGEQLTVDTGDPAFRQRFVDAERDHEAALAAAMRRCRVDMVSVSTDDDLVAALVEMSVSRSKRRR